MVHTGLEADMTHDVPSHPVLQSCGLVDQCLSTLEEFHNRVEVPSAAEIRLRVLLGVLCRTWVFS